MAIQAIAAASAVLLSATPSLAGPCDITPAPVEAYLAKHTAWSIVRERDLETYDQTLWRQSGNGSCPGYVAVDFEGDHHLSYGLVLMTAGHRGHRERLLILKHTRRGYREVTVSSGPAAIPVVVWRVGPGRASAWDGHRSVTVAHDSVVFEQMEAWAIQYWYAKGHLRYLLTSN